MAKRKTNKKRRKTTKKTVSNIDLAVVALIVVSILLGVLIYAKSGVIGVKLNEILGGMMGIIKYVLPIGIFAMAIKMAIDDDEYLSSKLAQCAILLISFAVLMCVYQVNVGNLTIDKSLSEVVKDSYALGTQEKGGGALGAILAVPLVKLLGPIGAIILCVGIVIILAVFVFGINASEIINNFIEKSQENREERLEQKQKNKEEQLKMRQEMLEEKRKAREQARQEALADNSVGEQIKINFGGRLIDDDAKGGKVKYSHEGEDLTPLTKETKKQKMQEIKENNQPDVIENNLFKQEEQKKEDKTK